jgi:nitrogen fixation-related uncharacterized protein
VNPFEEDEDSWSNEPAELGGDLGPDPPSSAPEIHESIDAGTDVSDGLFRAFWASVLLLNVALAALSIGVMLIYFRGEFRAGLLAVAIGAIAAAATGRYYWGVKTGEYTDQTSRDAGANDESNERENP